MSKNKESYFSAKKVDSSYIKKNGKRNISPTKKIISFILAWALLSSSGIAINKVYREKHNDFDISSITLGTLDNELNDDAYYEELYKNYRESLGGDEFVNELNDVYEEAIKYISELYGKLGLENSVQCYYLFNYLDDKGYLSVDNNKASRYINGNKDSYYLDLYKDNLIATDMLFKKSLCRHEAAFFEDTLNNYGIKAYALSCFMGEAGKKYNIKNPNHSVVVSEDLGTMIFDTLNDNIYDKTSITYLDSDPYIYFSYNTNDFLYMMPDCSSNEKTNIICEKLNEEEIDTAKKDMEKDKKCADNDYLKEQRKIVQSKIKTHFSDIKEFKNEYELNVKEKLPQTKR